MRFIIEVSLDEITWMLRVNGLTTQNKNNMLIIDNLIGENIKDYNDEN